MEKKTAEVIIIGAGVIGTSIAYHLAKFGCHDVIVIEKNRIGFGSTAQSGGGIRQQFSDELNIKLSLESIEFFKHFEEETGRTAEFHQYGYLYLFTTDEDLQRSRRNAALQRELGGYEVYFLSPKEVKELIPQVNIEGLIGASYCPTDGGVDPYSVVQGFASSARRLGVTIYQETEAVGIKMSRGQVQGVLLRDGQLDAPVVVNAGGPFAKQIGKMMGLDIPIKPYRRSMFYTAPTDEIRRDTPLIVDCSAGFAMRRRDKGLRFGMQNPNAPESLDTTVDWGRLPIILEAGAHRFPFLCHIGIMRGEAGLRSDTPDMSAILGGASEVAGLYLACGFSGHGLMHSPAVGRVMAEYITSRKPSAATSLLSLSRFKEGRLIR